MIIYDYNYVWNLIESGKIKKPFRKIKKRLFKKNKFIGNYLESDLFVLATKENIGAMYYEHGKNHVVTGFYYPGRWIKTKNKRGRIYMPSSGIKNENPDDYFCSCTYAELPKSKNEIESDLLISSVINSQNWDLFSEMYHMYPRFSTKSSRDRVKKDSEYLLDEKFSEFREFHKKCVESYFDLSKGFQYSGELGILRKEFVYEELEAWKKSNISI